MVSDFDSLPDSSAASDINTVPLSQSDLAHFFRCIPYRLFINDENYELDSDFLNFVYNLVLNSDMDFYSFKLSLPNNQLISVLNNLNRRLQIKSDDPIVVKETSEEVFDDLKEMLVDIQGLYWDNAEQRENFLRIRELKHNSFTNISNSKDESKEDVNLELINEMDSWKFRQYFKIPKPKLSHFQLRNNLVCLNNKKEIFYNELSNDKTITEPDMSLPTLHSVIKKLNPFSGEISPVLILEDDPIERVSTLECNDELIIAGTLSGSYYVKNIETQELTKRVLTTNSNGIINFAKAIDDYVLFSTNDSHLITTDLTSLKVKSDVEFPWAINSVSFDPQNQHLKLIVGDNINSFILDDRVHRYKPVNILSGHKDFSFTCDWSHNGMTIATGNQDSTMRLYDIRNLRKNTSCVNGEIESSIRNVKFNYNDTVIAFSESIDYVNILDLKSIDEGTGSKQVISLFGKVIGLDFTNYDDGNGELLTIGVCDDAIGGILQYELESDVKCTDYDFF